MSRVHEAWRRSQISDDSAAAPSPSIESPPVADAASSGGTAQPTALFPLREAIDPAAGAATFDAATFDAAAERRPSGPDTHSRRNQTFEELVREIARDEEIMRLTSRAAPSGASLLPRP